MKSTLLSLSFVLALAGTGAAFAQDQGQMQGPSGGDHHAAFKAACGADIQSFCASAQSRDDRHACVQANMSKFSDGCKSFLANHMHGQGNNAGGGQ